MATCTCQGMSSSRTMPKAVELRCICMPAPSRNSILSHSLDLTRTTIPRLPVLLIGRLLTDCDTLQAHTNLSAPVRLPIGLRTVRKNGPHGIDALSITSESSASTQVIVELKIYFGLPVSFDPTVAATGAASRGQQRHACAIACTCPQLRLRKIGDGAIGKHGCSPIAAVVLQILLNLAAADRPDPWCVNHISDIRYIELTTVLHFSTPFNHKDREPSVLLDKAA